MAGSSSPPPDNEHRRPVLRLPELLRHPGLLAVPDDRARAGQALRPPAPLPVRRPGGLHGRPSREIAADRAATAGTGRTSSTGPRSARTSCTSPSARSATRPLASATTPASRSTTSRMRGRAGGLPHHPRLPLALGHRLVLVLAALRRAEPDDPARCGRAATGGPTCTASSSPSTGSTASRRRSTPARGQPATGGGHPGRGDPRRARRRVPASSSPREVRHEPGLAVPAAAARRAGLAAVPAGARRGVRELRLLGNGPAAAGRAATGTTTG